MNLLSKFDYQDKIKKKIESKKLKTTIFKVFMMF